MFGLIGYPLKHSFSKLVHKKLGNDDYDLFELTKDELDNFFSKKEFIGINVTIPYKKEIFKYLDYIDCDAKNIGAVNTIYNNDGKLYGYNTDVLGLIKLIDYNNIKISGKNVLILGTGGTSNTAFYTVKKLGAKKIMKAYRKDSKVKGDVLYGDISNISSDIDVIINTTSNGMFPNNDSELLCDITKMPKLSSVIDVVYNPLRTRFMLEAENLNIKAVSGLYMLIAQAVYASNIFYKKVNENVINDIYKDCVKEKQNIVLIGMPSSGKTHLARFISEKYNYKLIDTDYEIEKEIGISVSDYIVKNGEKAFRDLETCIIDKISIENKCVIATGGGAILRDINVRKLKYNGKLFFINRSLDRLKATSDRPLTNDVKKLTDKYVERLPIYKSVADVEIDGDLEYDDKIKSIMEKV